MMCTWGCTLHYYNKRFFHCLIGLFLPIYFCSMLVSCFLKGFWEKRIHIALYTSCCVLNVGILGCTDTKLTWLHSVLKQGGRKKLTITQLHKNFTLYVFSYVFSRLEVRQINFSIWKFFFVCAANQACCSYPLCKSVSVRCFFPPNLIDSADFYLHWKWLLAADTNDLSPSSATFQTFMRLLPSPWVGIKRPCLGSRKNLFSEDLNCQFLFNFLFIQLLCACLLSVSCFNIRIWCWAKYFCTEFLDFCI